MTTSLESCIKLINLYTKSSKSSPFHWFQVSNHQKNKPQERERQYQHKDFPLGHAHFLVDLLAPHFSLQSCYKLRHHEPAAVSSWIFWEAKSWWDEAPQTQDANTDLRGENGALIYLIVNSEPTMSLHKQKSTQIITSIKKEKVYTP